MKKRKINSHSLDIEEIFLDDVLKKRGEEHWEVLDRKIEMPLKKRVFSVFLILGISLLLFLLIYTFIFQIINYDEYNKLALANKFLNLRIKSERGVIYDRNMEQLVFNEASFNLWLDKSDISLDCLERISEILNVSLDSLKEKIEQSEEESVLLAEGLSHIQLVLIETEIDSLSGIKIKKRNKRNYIEENSLSHILGYLGKISPDELAEINETYEVEDYVGKEGLEKEYEDDLAETQGILEIERDAKGNVISKTIKNEPSSGNSLVLSLDFELQNKLAQVLRQTVVNGDGQAAAGVILDPSSGDILASVSYPWFDNNVFAQGITEKELEKLNQDPDNPQLNRVIGGNYPIGSTIKPLISIAALEEEIIDEETSFFCPLELCLENEYTKELECFADWKFHGQTSIKKAIAESVNPFFYIIGGGYERPVFNPVDSRLPKSFEGLGSRTISQWLTSFGWGEKTGIDLPGEVQGRIPNADWKEEYFADRPLADRKWYLGDTYNLSIGQGYILITPLQVATAFQAVVNDGVIFKPKLVKKILYPDRQEKVLEPEVLSHVSISPETTEIVREAMRLAVTSTEGSAPYLRGLSVAVKTGTAETGKEDIYHNWITIFAPYDEPDIIMTLVIEDVKGSRVVAQTLARQVLEWYFNR